MTTKHGNHLISCSQLLFLMAWEKRHCSIPLYCKGGDPILSAFKTDPEPCLEVTIVPLFAHVAIGFCIVGEQFPDMFSIHVFVTHLPECIYSAGWVTDRSRGSRIWMHCGILNWADGRKSQVLHLMKGWPNWFVRASTPPPLKIEWGGMEVGNHGGFL